MEIILAFFIFITIAVDTLAISLKSVIITKRYSTVYVVSQAFTYITRFSLFFILPIIGFILDGFIEFNIIIFIYVFSFLLLAHSLFFILVFDGMQRKSKLLVYTFAYDLKKFFFNLALFFRGLTFSGGLIKSPPKPLYLYAVAHAFLSLVFPVLLMVGFMFNDFRATIMGAVSIYTGVFSLYIVFFIERKIANLVPEKRFDFIRGLVFSKSISLMIVAVVLPALTSFS